MVLPVRRHLPVSHRLSGAAVARLSAPDTEALPRTVALAVAVAFSAFTLIALAADHAAAPMPPSHLVATPVAMAITLAAWTAEALGWRLPRPVLTAAVLLPALALIVLGHSGPYLLHIMLMLAWMTYTGSSGEALLAGVGVLAVLAAGVAADAADGPLSVSNWLSWLAGCGVVWVLARSLRVQRDLSAQVQQIAVLEERQRLARELHDSVSQSLYSVSLLAEASRRAIAAGQTEGVAENLALLGTSAQQALKAMRLLLFELQPAVLETEGLGGALRLRLDAVEKRAGVATTLEVDDTLVLAPAVQAALYGVAQEALNNTLKHAGARSVQVTLRQEPGALVFAISDDGRGFDPGRLDDRGGLGMESMRARAAGIGAALEVRSAPGAGTTLELRLPIAAPALLADSAET